MSLWKLQKDGTLIEAKNVVYAPDYTIYNNEKSDKFPDGWKRHNSEDDARKAFGLPSLNVIELIEKNGFPAEDIKKIIEIVNILERDASLKEEFKNVKEVN